MIDDIIKKDLENIDLALLEITKSNKNIREGHSIEATKNLIQAMDYMATIKDKRQYADKVKEFLSNYLNSVDKYLRQKEK
jgi:hypothetical protein